MATWVIVRWYEPYQVSYCEGWQALHAADDTNPSVDTRIGRLATCASGVTGSRVSTAAAPSATAAATMAPIGSSSRAAARRSGPPIVA